MSRADHLESVDVDGAIREAEADVANDTRADFFRKAAVGGGAMIGGGVLLSGFPSHRGRGKPSKKQDMADPQLRVHARVLEAAFYNEALKNGALTGEVLATTKHRQPSTRTRTSRRSEGARQGCAQEPEVRLQEHHVATRTFPGHRRGARGHGRQGLLGPGRPRIKRGPMVKAALSILTVEARHAAQFRQLNGQNFAPARVRRGQVDEDDPQGRRPAPASSRP